jgi:uncharacterized SAM-binding protein YcdF (DUF218 family)
MPRLLALLIGAFSLANIVDGILRPGFDANVWWIDLRPIPNVFADLFLASAGILLLTFAIAPEAGKLRQRATLFTTSALAAATFWNVCHFYRLLNSGHISPAVPIPFSLFILGALLVILFGVLRQNQMRSGVEMFASVAAASLLIVLLPLALMYCFGKTDYRRQADAIVVFGARTYADGTPSMALADRVRTGCELYHSGLAPKLIFSGGPGDGEIHETEAMRRMAVSLGVPDDAIIMDKAGLNTHATVRNTHDIFEQHGVKRVLAVSHFYHLPRVKLCYQRAGLEVYTVPAKESRTLPKMPYLMAREVAAMWAYYFF